MIESTAPLQFGLDCLPTPIGTMLLITDTSGRLRALDWADYGERMRRLLRLHYGEGNVVLKAVRAPQKVRGPLECYFAGDLDALAAISVHTHGTEFQRCVWRELCTIPPGTTTTYASLAQRIGRSTAIRAVGMANGANPVGVVVPCHRLIGTNGSLTGFGGGIERKRWLLMHEGAFQPS